MSRHEQTELARLAARLALRAIQAPAKRGTLALAIDAQDITNQTARHAPQLVALHAACIRAGVTECNEGEQVAMAHWRRIKATAQALAPWLLSLGLVLDESGTDPRGPMLTLRAAPENLAPGWPPLFDTDTANAWRLPC